MKDDSNLGILNGSLSNEIKSIIALFSVISAIVAILMYIALFVSEASVLSQWDIPIELIDISDKSKIYKLGITVLSFVLIGSTTVYAVLYVRSITFFAKHLAAMRVRLTLLQSEDTNNEIEIDALNSDIKTLQKYSIIEVLKRLVFPILLFGIMYFSLNAYTFESSKTMLISWVLLPIIYLLSLINEWRHSYSLAKDEFKKTNLIPEKYLNIEKCLNNQILYTQDLDKSIWRKHQRNSINTVGQMTMFLNLSGMILFGFRKSRT